MPFLPAGSKWSPYFFATVVITAAVVLALLCYIFGNFEHSVVSGAPDGADSHTVPTYLALFIFAEVYQVILCWDALRARNTIQLIGMSLFSAALLVYSAIQYDQIRNAITQLWQSKYYDLSKWPLMKAFIIAIPCVLGVSTVLLGFLTYKLYEEFGWSMYKHVGADIALKRRYMWYLIFLTLVKYDFFFFLGFTIQFVVIVLNIHDIEFALTIAVIPVTIAILYLALYFTKREKTLPMILIVFVFFAGLAYFLFKMVRMYQPSQAHKYVATRKTLTAFAVMTIILITATIVNAIVCISNFDTGLLPVINRDSTVTEEEKYPLTDFNSGYMESRTRMTID